MFAHLGNPRVRDDLIWVRNGSKGLDRWTVKDPSNSEFYYFTSIEKDVIDLFRGDKDVLQIHEALQQLKPGCDWSLPKLFSFLQVLLFNNLVLCDQYGKGGQLSRLVQRQTHRRRYGWLTQPLSIRIPLFRPQLLLQLLQPLGNFLFHPMVILAVLLLGAVSFALAALQWNEIATSLPPVESLIRGDRIILMVCTLACIKSLHELGHAMACQKYAGNCGEIGVMLLVFTPCLYCDVSPSWMVENRWKRVAIALAGIYIELILSLIAVFCLLFIPSEVVRANAIYIFVVCTLGTVLLNGNPLVKYDGYFALSDLLGVPNLADQAREAASYTFLTYFARKPPPVPPLDFSRTFLVVYWALATVYRLLLLVLILWGINLLLRPLGLEFIAYYIGVIAVTGLFWNMIRTLIGVPNLFQNHGGLRVVNAVGGLVAISALIGFVCLVPVTDSVEARAMIRFERMSPVFVQQPGTFVAGQHKEGYVKKGDVIFELDSSDRKAQELTAAADVELTSLKLQLRKELSVLAVEDDLQIPTLEKTLDIRKKQLESIELEAKQLVYQAPHDGYWFHALPSFITANHQKSLRPWSGYPLEDQNLGAHFEKGILLGWLVDRERPVLEVFVPETELNRLEVGLRTSVRFEHDAMTSLDGAIAAIGTEPIAFLPIELGGDWYIMAQPDAEGRWIPESPMFRVVVQLDTAPSDLPMGGKATVQIKTQPLTLAEQAYRFLRQTIFYRRQQAG